MRVVMVSSDRNLFDPASDVAKRMLALGSLLTHLEVIVFTLAKDGFQVKPLSRTTIIRPTNSRSKATYIKDAIEIGKLGGPEIVTAQDPFECGAAGARIARNANVPLQIQLHTDISAPAFQKGLRNKIRRFIAKRTLQSAAGIRAVSKRSLASLQPLLRGRSVPSVIIPVFTDIGNFLAGGAARLNVAHPEFRETILVVSRLAPEKNVRLALDAFASLHEKHASTGLFIIGEGRERKSLERRAKNLGIEKSVIFMGDIKNPTSMFRGADLFLHTADYEGYGLVLLEAAAAGRPIVTTNVGIVGELLEDGKHCLVCPPGDVVCMAEKMGSLMNNAPLRKQYGDAAAALAAPFAERSLAAWAKEIKKALQDLVDANRLTQAQAKKPPT